VALKAGALFIQLISEIANRGVDEPVDAPISLGRKARIVEAARAPWSMIWKASPASGIRKRYQSKLTDLIRRLVSQDIDAADFVDVAFSATTSAYWDAFNLGRQAGGIDEDVDVNSEEAGIVMAKLVFAHASISKIVALLGQPPDPALQSQALARVPAIGAAIETLYYEGLASGTANPLYQWIIGGTKEHCTDCLAYNGQRHRIKDWEAAGAIPQTFGLECRGFKCQCELRRSPGREIGTLAPPGMN